MRQFTLASTVAIPTFLFGLLASAVWSNLSPHTVSLCEIAAHADQYNQRIIRLPATIYGGYGILVIGDANCSDSEAFAIVDLDESCKDRPEVRAFLDQLGRVDESQRLRSKAQVTLVGKFDQGATFKNYSPRFGILVSNLEIESSVTLEPRPGW
jgi:hypothetical protein